MKELVANVSEFVLPYENKDEVGDDALATRAEIASQLAELPAEAFSRVQNFQPEVGCAHGCSFCAQGAGGEVVSLTKHDVRNLVAATAVAARVVAQQYEHPERVEKHGLLGYDRIGHKPGVIFPYFDNEPLAYPHLDEVVKGLHEVMGSKIRISTVGYNPNNAELHAMHQRLASEHADAFDGMRFSFSRYPKDWKDPEAYEDAMATTMRTYRPVVDALGYGKDEGAAELRYAPNIETSDSPLDDLIIGGHHVVRSGPYLLVSLAEQTDVPQSSVVGIDGRAAVPSSTGLPYQMFVSDANVRNGDWQSYAEEQIEAIKNAKQSGDVPPEFMTGEDTHNRQVQLYEFTNPDGPYYAVDPSFTEDGMFTALHLYQQTETRKVSGYLDTTRYFLNELLEYKYGQGLERRQSLDGANWEHVGEVVAKLEAKEHELAKYNQHAAEYVRQEVTPLIGMYCRSLEKSGYGPGAFFDRFTMDTGTIVNLGRSKALFKGLVSQEDMPLTPQEERGYGDETSIAATRGRIWRWAPSPFLNQGERLRRSLTGLKNTAAAKGMIALRELDYHTLTEFTPEGKKLRTAHIGGFTLNKLMGKEAQRLFTTIPIEVRE